MKGSKRFKQQDKVPLSKEELRMILLKGFVTERKIIKDSHSSGVIRVPASLIGKWFRIILVPMKEVIGLDL